MATKKAGRRPPKSAAPRPAAFKAAKTKPAAKKSIRIDAAAQLRAGLARHGFPRPPGPGLGFSPADDALFERGYPNLKILDDTPLEPKAAHDLAERALDAIDPVLRVRVPRALAAPYLRGYRVGPLLFVDRNHPPENESRRARRSEAIRSGDPITVSLLEATLREQVVGMGKDTYVQWRLAEVLHLYEHFVGSEAVARAVTDHLVQVGTDLSSWGFAGDPQRTNAAPHSLAMALPWILRRVAPTLATELRGRLGRVKPRAEGTIDPRPYFSLLSVLAQPSAPLSEDLEALAVRLGLAHEQAEPVRRAYERQPKNLVLGPGRLVWLLGSDLLAGPISVTGALPLPLLDSVAPLRDPGVVRFAAHLATSRAAAQEVAKWLTEHADYARPILETLAALDDPREKKFAARALELLGGAPLPSAPASAQELEREIAQIFSTLGGQLRAGGDREVLMQHIRDAHEAYTEARASVGDPTPDAYFTHRFGDFGLGQWAMLAVDAI
jgi:hypothetical protein